MFIWTLLLSLGQAGTISDAMHLGDCHSVLTATAVSDSEKLAQASCHLKQENWDAAFDVSKTLKEGVIGDYSRWVEAQALFELQKPQQAYQALETLTLPGSLAWQVPLARGRALVLAGDSLKAREGLRQLLKSPGQVEARFWLAKGGEDRGELAAAIATYEHVWAHGVRGNWDERAASQLEALNTTVPNPDTHRGLQLIQTRMNSLKTERQYSDALELLELIHTVQPPTTESAKLKHARAIFKARKYKESVIAFQSCLGDPASASGSANDLFNYGLTLARSGDYDAALIVYGRLIEQHPTTERADFGSFKRGYTEYDRRNLLPAIAEFERHIRDRKGSKYLDEAIWFLGLSHWLNNNTSDALKTWARLPIRRPKSPLVSAAKYWTARLKGLSGDTESETTGYETLLKEHPTSGHAWYAAHRLNYRFPTAQRQTAPDWPQKLANTSQAIRADILLNGGFTHWARDEMKPLQAIAESQGRAARLAAAWRFIRAGDYRTGQQLARPYCVKPWLGGDPVAQQACHPMPESNVVEHTAQQYGVYAYLPYGVMIAESALKPWVTSHAGARGLMQLMPQVGERLAKELNPDKIYHPDQLYSASFNAKLGTTELGQRTKSLDGVLMGTSLPAIIASYNGGEAAVRRWVGSFEETPEFDVFAETIGYAETRRYVRRVLSYIMRYRWIYGDLPVTSSEGKKVTSPMGSPHDPEPEIKTP